VSLPVNYQAWQNHFRPEDTGRRDGEKGEPAETEKSSHWEESVVHAAEATIDELCRKFCGMEPSLTARRDDLERRRKIVEEDFERYRNELRRDPLILIPGKWALTAVVGLGIAGSAASGLLLASIWPSWPVYLHILGAIIVSFALTLLSYFGGVAVRQAKSERALVIVGGVFLLVSVFLLYAGTAFSPDQEASQKGIFFVFAEVVVMLSCLFVSYYSHDPVEGYAECHRAYARLLSNLAMVKGQIEAGRRMHGDHVDRVREIAGRIIRTPTKTWPPCLPPSNANRASWRNTTVSAA
jgi:hypothetical protein